MSFQHSKNRDIYLIGSTSETLTGSELPSYRLSRLLQLHLRESVPIQNGARVTANELWDFWYKARIPTKQKF